MDRICLSSVSRPQAPEPSAPAAQLGRKRSHARCAQDGACEIAPEVSTDGEHDVMCFWAYTKHANKRRRGTSYGADISGGAGTAEAKDRLYLTSAENQEGATRIISLPRTLMRERYPESPLAVASALPPEGAGAQDNRIGANDPTRHIWPTTLSHSALGHLRTLVTREKFFCVPPDPMCELLVFSDQHLLAGLPSKMARRLASGLTSQNVVDRFALAHSYLHVDSEGAFASLAHACYNHLVSHFDNVCKSRRYKSMQPQVQADFLAGVIPTLNARFDKQAGYEVLPRIQSAVLYALRTLSPTGLHRIDLSKLLHGAIQHEVPDVLQAVQQLVSLRTYTRMLSAHRAAAISAAASFDCETTLQSVLKHVDKAAIRHCLVRDDYALVMSIGQRGRTQALDTLLAYLSKADIDTVCTHARYLPSALGCQQGLSLFYWLKDRVGTATLGVLLRDLHCTALLTAIRHNRPSIFGAYFTCATEQLCFYQMQPLITRVVTIALNRGRSEIILDVFDTLLPERVWQLVTSDHARLLRRLLSDGDVELLRVTWHSFSKPVQTACLNSHARELCAAAVLGGHEALSLTMFGDVSHGLTDLNVEHPFAVAMQGQNVELALQMFQQLDTATRRNWASDPEMRAMRLAAQAGALRIIDALVAEAPSAVIGLAQAEPHSDHRLLKAMLRAPVSQGLAPVFIASSLAWREAHLRYNNFELIAHAIEVGAADCLQFLLSELSDADHSVCLMRLVPRLLPAVLRDRDAGTSHTLAQAAPALWSAALRHDNWELMRRMLHTNPHFVTDTLRALPEDALNALWAEHGAAVLFAGLNNRRLGGYLMDRFDVAQRQALLLADDALLLHRAFDADVVDADILIHLHELTDAQQREVATQRQCRMLRRRPNVAFDQDVFALLAQHLTADEVLGLIRGPSSAGFDAQLCACPLAFESQMRLMADTEREVVVDYIAGLLQGLGPS